MKKFIIFPLRCHFYGRDCTADSGEYILYTSCMYGYWITVGIMFVFYSEIFLRNVAKFENSISIWIKRPVRKTIAGQNMTTVPLQKYLLRKVQGWEFAIRSWPKCNRSDSLFFTSKSLFRSFGHKKRAIRLKNRWANSKPWKTCKMLCFLSQWMILLINRVLYLIVPIF